LVHIELEDDRPRRAVLAEALVALPEPWGHAPTSLARWTPVTFTVDTGAFNSAIADAVARALAIPVETLPLKPIGGATGLGLRPVLLGLFLQPRAARIGPVLLPRVTVLPASLEAPAPPDTPPSLRGLSPPAASLNLLGMDFLEHVGASVTLDLPTGRGHLQWA
jgi:hypothetical protein